MSNFGNERSSVQNPLIQYATQVGWEQISQVEAERLRGGKSGLVFKEVFSSQVAKLNGFLAPVMIADKLKELERLPARKEGNLQAWEYLKGLRTVFLPNEKRERNVKINR